MRIEYQLFFMQGNFFLFVRIHFLLFFGFVYKIYQKKKKKKNFSHQAYLQIVHLKTEQLWCIDVIPSTVLQYTPDTITYRNFEYIKYEFFLKKWRVMDDNQETSRWKTRVTCMHASIKRESIKPYLVPTNTTIRIKKI